MSSYLITLLPELQEQIFSYCHAADIKNVACCNSTHNEAITEILWQTITISWKCLSHKDFIILESRKLPNLQYTRIIRFASYYSEKDWTSSAKDIMMSNYNKVLEFCNTELLHTLFIEDVLVEEPAVKNTCQLLNELKTFSFVNVSLNTDIFQHIVNLRTLTALDLQNTGIDDSYIVNICTSGMKLKSLNLAQTKVTDIGLSLLAEHKSLENLVLSYCNISDHGMSDIGTLMNLKELDVSHCHISDNGLSALENLSLLCMLDLDSCTEVTDRGLHYISSKASLQNGCPYAGKIVNDDRTTNRLPCLKSLIIDSTGITDNGLEYISNNLQLETVSINFTDITNDGVKYLSVLTSLMYLDLSETSVTDDGMMHLSSLTHLRELKINDCEYITDIGLLSVPSCIEVIDISGTEVTDHCLEYLCILKRLKELQCHDSNITDAGLHSIGKMLSLESLGIGEAKITDCGLLHLTSLRLRTLNVAGTEVTDVGLSHISQMKYLVKLDISYTKITNGGLTHLRLLAQLIYLECSGTSMTCDGLCTLPGQIQRINFGNF